MVSCAKAPVAALLSVTSTTHWPVFCKCWAVADVTCESRTTAFAQLTTSQATRYYPASQSNWNDAVLASTAFVIDGDVQSAPVTESPITIGKLMIAGPVSTGLTEAEAEALAAQLS